MVLLVNSRFWGEIFVLRVIGKDLSQILELIFSLGVFGYGHNLVFPQLWLILMYLMTF